MKGLVLEKIGGEYTLVDTIEKPSPGKGQILVKSLATAFNPVYAHLPPLSSSPSNTYFLLDI